MLAKGAAGERRSDEALDHAIRQIVSKAMVSDDVVDIFAAAGSRKPDISILSDETANVIEELIQLALDLREAGKRGEALGLTDDEVASTTRSKRTTARSRCSATRH